MDRIKLAREILDKHEQAKRHALYAGMGSLGAGAGAIALGQHRTQQDLANIPKHKHWRTFKKDLRPGDIVMSRSKEPGLSPMTQAGVEAFLGTDHNHVQLYAGKGKVLEVQGSGKNVKMRDAKKAIGIGEDLIIYRPKLSKKEIRKGLERAKKLKGLPYEHGHLKRVLSTLAGYPGKLSKEEVVCSDIIAKAYPQLFKGPNIPFTHIHQNEGLKPISHLRKIREMPLTARLTSRVAHPLLHSLKWAVPAAAGAYGLSRYLSREQE
jgi:uncharacterized protein YycO